MQQTIDEWEEKYKQIKISYVNIYNENKEYRKSFDMFEKKLKEQEQFHQNYVHDMEQKVKELQNDLAQSQSNLENARE